MGTLDQLNVVEDKLSREGLKMIVGGARFSGSIINAFTSAFKTLYGIGQDFGSAIRRIRRKKLCSL